MAKRKYVAQNRIMGLGPRKVDANGRWAPHEVKLGEVVELDPELPETQELVNCGALKEAGLLPSLRGGTKR